MNQCHVTDKTLALSMPATIVRNVNVIQLSEFQDQSVPMYLSFSFKFLSATNFSSSGRRDIPAAKRDLARFNDLGGNLYTSNCQTYHPYSAFVGEELRDQPPKETALYLKWTTRTYNQVLAHCNLRSNKVAH